MIKYNLINFKTKKNDTIFLENAYGKDLINHLEKINNITQEFYFINIFYKGETKVINYDDKFENNKKII